MTPEQKAASRRAYAELKAAVLAHYGTACACCGTAQGLTIDHIGGDGKQHRTELFGGNGTCWASQAMYKWLIRNGFPAGFQTLCKPCNSSKGTGELCHLDHALASRIH